MSTIAKRANGLLERTLGLRVKRLASYPADFPADLVEIADAVRPYTLVPHERIDSICRAIDYIVEAEIPGDIVECGVWRGGMMMAAALRLRQHGDTSRALWLYDTFEGMPEPGDIDGQIRGRKASDIYQGHQRQGTAWVAADVEDVRANMDSTGYPLAEVRFVRGLVEDTIPGEAPDQIAVLRLDTDFYSSTAHELEHLVPRVSANGVLIVDDYGTWAGSRKAVDEYFASSPVLLSRVDTGCVMGVVPKPGD